MTTFEKLSKKWSKEILMKLSSSPKGFQELLRTLAGKRPRISSRTLSDRLVDLEEAGLIKRDIVKGRPPRSIYSITKKGRKVLSLIEEINRL